MYNTLIEFLQFVAHAAMLSATMNNTLDYYGGVKLTTVQEAAAIVHELSYGFGGDMRSFSLV